MKKIIFYLGNFSLFIATPAFAACDLDPSPTIGGLLTYVTCLLTQAVVPLIFTLAFVFFIYGVVQYMLNPSDEAKKTKGKSFMIWGIIALTVMFSVFGIVNMLGGSFKLLDDGISPPVVNLD